VEGHGFSRADEIKTDEGFKPRPPAAKAVNHATNSPR
jgi:hypothetical protein